MDPYERSRMEFDRYAAMDAPHLPPSKMSALQVRLARWANRQFPGHELWEKTLGVSEELGELAEALIGMGWGAGRLAHAVIKSKHKIRGFDSEEKLRRAAADAVGDVCVFAIQACTHLRLDFGALLEATAEEVLTRDFRGCDRG